MPIEAGPPPAAELVLSPAVETAAPEPVAAGPEVVDPPPPPLPAAETESVRPADAQAELPWSVTEESRSAAVEAVPLEATPEPQPVPANDVISGPVVQPIVIGAESTPPLERKRGWWRRR